MKKRSFKILATVFAVMITMSFTLFLAVPEVGAQAGTVRNKVYDAWVSQSFAGPPFTPFHDCFGFSSTQTSLAGCGDVGPLSIVPLLGGALELAVAEVPCGGLDLVFLFIAVDAAGLPIGANVAGGIGIGRFEGTAFSVELIQNQNCTYPYQGEGNPYSAQ